MEKCYVENLAMIITDRCNLDCAHCLRGKKCNRDMSDEVVESTLSQIRSIGNLAINGGEPTLAIDVIEKIINYVIDKQIKLQEFTVTINGTIYSEKLLELLDTINKYIGDEDINSLVAISLDRYHIAEVERLRITEEFNENLRRYSESKHFYGWRNTDKKLFSEGNASNFDPSETVPIRPMKPVTTYMNVDNHRKFDLERGVFCVGPIIAISPTGIITECDASIEHQETIYNYGNVLTTSIQESTLGREHTLIKRPARFRKEAYKEYKRYQTYNK